MSEAVNPNIGSELSPSDEPGCSADASVESEPSGISNHEFADDDWQTVDFPDAMSLAAIASSEPSTELTQTSVINSSTMSNPFDQANSSENPAADTSLSEQLHQENAELRAQVAQLEQDLGQLQVELQLEVARFYCKEQESREASGDRPQEAINAAEQQIGQLTDDLELSQQVVERQQILVETLTNQLEHCQERIAQLERDCALSQQRYNEQTQLTLQAEHACQDLRMRLHRQQRQALQFKAALEKSLETNTASVVVPTEPEPVISPAQPSTPDSPFFVPKAQPVRPWSTQPETVAGRFYTASSSEDAAALPNLLSKLRVTGHTAQVEGSEVVEAELPNLELAQGKGGLAKSMEIAPAEAIAPSSQPTAQPTAHLFQPSSLPAHSHFSPTPSPQAAIFDLSPFLEAGEVDPESIAATHLPTSAPSQSAELSVQDSADAAHNLPAQVSDSPFEGSGEDTLWADLAKLIEPDTIAENAAISASLTISATEPPTLDQSSQPNLGSLPFQPLPFQSLSEQPLSEQLKSEPAGLGMAESENQGQDEGDRAAQPQSLSPTFLPFELDSYAPAQPIEHLHVAAQSKSPSFDLVSVGSGFALDDYSLSTDAAPSSGSVDSNPANWPSPVLYPLRSPKKLKSMAAVDLPTFPRARQ